MCGIAKIAILSAAALVTSACFGATADTSAPPTFSKDIAPILQRSCQNCHNPKGVAPMSLVTYDEVRPWAKDIAYRTALRDKRGAMPPWFIEKNIGIQHFKNDPSLTDEEIALITKWASSGSPQGTPADLPAPRAFEDENSRWTLGEPDLIVSTPEVTVKAGAPDYWGELTPAPTGLTEDRWVKSVEIREVNDISKDPGRKTVGARYVFHHMIWTTAIPTTDLTDPTGGGLEDWPTHEVGRNADVFPDDAGKLLKAHSEVVFESAHIHSSGQDVKAKLLYGFKFFPKGYEPKYKYARNTLGNGVDIDIHANEGSQRLDAYQVLTEPREIVSFEPHLHAPGMRMCLEYIWGYNVQTLSCAGYDHNWVRVYEYQDDYRPLLPKGSVLHIIGYMDNTAANSNVTDPRNWSGSGNRSISNMFIDLGRSLTLTDDEFYEEMAKRKTDLKLRPHEMLIGCPLCTTDPVPPAIKRLAPSESAEAGLGGQR
jgi:hypothetical protein